MNISCRGIVGGSSARLFGDVALVFLGKSTAAERPDVCICGSLGVSEGAGLSELSLSIGPNSSSRLGMSIEEDVVDSSISSVIIEWSPRLYVLDGVGNCLYLSPPAESVILDMIAHEIRR